MKVLVLNCGSSSLKYQLFDMGDERVLAKGLIERIGIEGSRLKHTKVGSDAVSIETSIPDHKVAVKLVLDALLDKGHGVLSSLDELSAVGHRVVHAGEKFACSVRLDGAVMDALKECVPLAPLHNPANITGIEAITAVLPEVPQVGVFDTAFHQTMPKEAYMYGIPYRYYEDYKVRRYGFHGTSHFFVANRCAEILGKPIEDLKIITCHLGNGSSITAVKNGKCVDTTMGFTPLAGVLMGTRCGDIDPSIVKFIAEKEGSVDKADSLLNKESGVHGVSGISSDLRDIEDGMAKGDERATLAFNMLSYGITKYIGAYAAAMGGVDAIVFTAGIGENCSLIRESATASLGFLGVSVDSKKNDFRGEERVISSDDSKVKVVVVPTNEELVIARDTKKLVSL
ncbi:acetate/propionate family kinase [Dethiosulfovibrio salsuginis]|uniref:Acetate kinase n=1 Tax=Dethiosulfovibrio salsuginis TaxID=561720 RepID=A0A1X7IB77_9BACT|nr:acetate kinase [Dethiosulfovibrio salsuginis]SMG11282.1 acetate kinase [Dethiosulfovibrio salsuginis]